MANQNIYVPAQFNEECSNMWNAAWTSSNDQVTATENTQFTPSTLMMVEDLAHTFDPMSNPSFGSSFSTPMRNDNNHCPRVVNPLGFKINGTFPVRNQPVSGSSAAIVYRNQPGPDLLPRSQQLGAVSYTKKRPFWSIDGIPYENHPYHLDSSFISSMPPNISFPTFRQSTHINNQSSTFHLQGDGVSKKHAYNNNPMAGGISFAGNDAFFSMGGQKNLSSFAVKPSRGSGVPYNNAMSYAPYTSGINFNPVGEIPQSALQNCCLSRISTCMYPNKYGALTTCSECGMEFPTHHALAGHASAHAKIRRQLERRAQESHVSPSIINRDVEEYFSMETKELLARSAATFEKLEAFFISYWAAHGGLNSSVLDPGQATLGVRNSSVVDSGLEEDAGSSTSIN